jgi:hypothetical protein
MTIQMGGQTGDPSDRYCTCCSGRLLGSRQTAGVCGIQTCSRRDSCPERVTAKLTYFEIVASIYHLAAIRAGKQAGRWVDRLEGRGQSRQAGRQEAGRQAGRIVRVWEGRKECRGYGKSSRKRYRKTDVPMYILTGRNIYAQTYTNEWTYRWPVRKCWYRVKNRQAYSQTNIHTYCICLQYRTYTFLCFVF